MKTIEDLKKESHGIVDRHASEIINELIILGNRFIEENPDTPAISLPIGIKISIDWKDDGFTVEVQDATYEHLKEESNETNVLEEENS